MQIPGFTIREKLGTGARSTIYKASDDQTGQIVALKRVVLEQAEDARVFEQMETELKVSKNIDHKFIRKCYKIIRRRKLLKTSEILMTMEMVEGVSLERSKSLSLIDIMVVFRMVTEGLNAMHQAGYVHCDMKPNNIMINLPKAEVKIIDLGQSCEMGTVKTRIQGTPDYIAPEQVRKQPLTHRTDIFNLGATFYWAMTGKNVPTLIPQKNELGAIAKVPQALPPAQIYRKIPLALSNLVMECVQDNPAERPSSMGDIIARLDVIIHDVMGY
ncbi:MAG: serine/threonine-protein kinase [Sedimentisphaeraceae bacterium JB056]